MSFINRKISAFTSLIYDIIHGHMLNVLPEDNSCHGCPNNCCNPVMVGHPRNFLFPLPKGGAPPEFIIKAEEVLARFVREFVENILSLPADRRFSLKGIILSTEEQDDTATEIVMRQNIPFIVLHIRLALSCTAFDQPTGICTRYDTRPDLCRDFSVDTYGLSKISRPKQKPDGSHYTIPELVESNQRFQAAALPTLEEAMDALRIKLKTIDF